MGLASRVARRREDDAGSPPIPRPPPQPQAPSAGAADHVPFKVKLGFFMMVIGMFMAILDIQIVSSSLSEIQAGLSASADEISWVQTAYLIAEVIMIPLSGFLSRLLSTRVLFTISAAGFTLMSLACAFAWSIGSMVIFRAAQGFLGGAMIPTVFAASFIMFPGKARAGITAIIGLVATSAPTLGPTLGGYLTQLLSWHWLFLINLAPGAVVILGVWFLVDFDKPDRSLLKDFDISGLLLMAGFLGALEYFVEEGPRNDWLDDETIRITGAIALVCGILFFWRVLVYRQPIVDLRAFADRNFAIGSLFSFVLGIGLYGSVYILPLFLARIRGFNSLQIGETMFVTGVFQMLCAPIIGRLTTKLDLRAMMGVGLVLFAVAIYYTGGLTNQSGFYDLFWPQALRGVALMMCFIPINTLALGTLPRDKLKNGSGLYNLTRNLGGAIGLALINTVMTDRLALHWGRLADSVNMGRAEIQAYVENFGARMGDMLPGDGQLAAIKQLAGLVQREAYVMTFNDVLLLMSGLYVGALLLMPLVRKPPAAGGAGSGGH